MHGEALTQAKLTVVAHVLLDREQALLVLVEVVIAQTGGDRCLPHRVRAQPEVVADVHVAVLVDELVGYDLVKQGREFDDLLVRGKCGHKQRRYLPRQPPREPTARAMTSREMSNAEVACTPISALARIDSGMVSVGLKALELVSDTYR